jgi:hypothetical protein
MYLFLETCAVWRCRLSKLTRCSAAGVILAITGLVAHAQDPFPAAPERDLVMRTCSGCHAPEIVTAKRRTEQEWDDIIGKMVDHGAQANESQQEQILAYLVRFFGKPSAP